MTVAVRRGLQPRPEHHRQPREMIMEIPRSLEDSDEDNSSAVADEGRVDEEEEKEKEAVVKPQRKRVYLHRCPFKHGCSHNNNKQVSHNVSEASLNILRDYNIRPDVTGRDFEEIDNLCQAAHGVDNRYLQFVKRMNRPSVEYVSHGKHDTKNIPFLGQDQRLALIQRGLEGGGGQMATSSNVSKSSSVARSIVNSVETSTQWNERLSPSYNSVETSAQWNERLSPSYNSVETYAHSFCSSNPFFSSSHFLCATTHSSTYPRHIFFSSSTSSSATPSPGTYNSPTVGVNPHSSYIKRISDTANVFASLGLSVTKDFSLPPPPPSPHPPPSHLSYSTPSSPPPLLLPPPSSKHYTTQEKHEESSSSSDSTHLLVSTSLQEPPKQTDVIASTFQTDVIASTFRKRCKKFFLETLCPGATESDIQQVVSAVNSLEDRVYLCNSHSKMDYCYQLATKLCSIQEELQRISKVNQQGDAALKRKGGGDPS